MNVSSTLSRIETKPFGPELFPLNNATISAQKLKLNYRHLQFISGDILLSDNHLC